MSIKSFYTKIKKHRHNFIVFKPFIWLYKRNRIIARNERIDQFNVSFEQIFSKVLPSPIILELNEFLGIFELDIRSDLFRTIAFNGNYENDFLRLVAKYIDTGKDVIDIGANVGFFSVYFAKTIEDGCKVLSIEPTPNAFGFLKNNVSRNKCSHKVILYNGAITNQTGETKLNTIEGREEYSSISEIDNHYIGNDEVSQITVQSTTLDNLVKEKQISPGFIKIDTEGAEFLVISGALKTLQEFNPIIITELCDDFLQNMGHSAKNIIDLLNSLNYKIINAKTLSEYIKYPFNGEIIAIPQNLNFQPA